MIEIRMASLAPEIMDSVQPGRLFLRFCWSTKDLRPELAKNIWTTYIQGLPLSAAADLPFVKNT